MAARPQYIYEMDYSKRQELNSILDMDDSWKRLASEIDLSTQKIMEIDMRYQRIGKSATDALLTYWGHSNPTVAMLESALIRLNLHRAADVVRCPRAPDSLCDNSSRMRTGLASSNGSYHGPSSNGRTQQGIGRSGGLFEINQTGHSQNASENDEFGFPLPFQEDRTGKQHQMSSSLSPHRQPLGVNCFTSKMNIVGSPGSNSPICKSGNCNGTTYTSSDNDIGDGGRSPCSNKRPSSYGSSVNFNVSQDKRSSRPDTTEREVVREERNRPTPTIAERVDGGKSNRSSSSVSSAGSVGDMQSMILHPYSIIVAATRNFSLSQLIGEGGFGKVYSGNIQSTMSAIKVLSTTADQADFLAEVKFLQKFRHKNIIMLSGCSIDGPCTCIIYEFMVNGSLRDRLECLGGSRPLTWDVRQSILKDAAAGLQYLHNAQTKPLIHGDMKSANILIGPHFEAKISDFGLAKEATGGSIMNQYTHVTHKLNETVFGTRPYLPECFFKDFTFSMRTDTHGFGIVIFETCTGEKPYDGGRQGGKMLLDYVQCISSYKNDDKILGMRDKRAADWPNELWMKLVKIGSLCTSELKIDVPTMKQVYYAMEQLVKLMQVLPCNRPSPKEVSPVNKQKFVESPNRDSFKENGRYQDIEKWNLQQQAVTRNNPKSEVRDAYAEAFLDYDKKKLALSSETYETNGLPNLSSMETTAVRPAVREFEENVGAKVGGGFAWSNALRRSIDGCDEKELISVLRREDAATALPQHHSCINPTATGKEFIHARINAAKLVDEEHSVESLSSVFTDLTFGTTSDLSSTTPSPGIDRGEDDGDQYSTDENCTTTDTDEDLKFENIDYSDREWSSSVCESKDNDTAMAERFLKDQQKAANNLPTMMTFVNTNDRAHTVDMRMVDTDDISRLKNKKLTDFFTESFQESNVDMSGMCTGGKVVSNQDSTNLRLHEDASDGSWRPLNTSDIVEKTSGSGRADNSYVDLLSLESNPASYNGSSSNQRQDQSRYPYDASRLSKSPISLDRVLAEDLERGQRLDALKQRRLLQESSRDSRESASVK